jgi:hypothetical protein
MSGILEAAARQLYRIVVAPILWLLLRLVMPPLKRAVRRRRAESPYGQKPRRFDIVLLPMLVGSRLLFTRNGNQIANVLDVIEPIWRSVNASRTSRWLAWILVSLRIAGINRAAFASMTRARGRPHVVVEFHNALDNSTGEMARFQRYSFCKLNTLEYEALYHGCQTVLRSLIRHLAGKAGFGEAVIDSVTNYCEARLSGRLGLAVERNLWLRALPPAGGSEARIIICHDQYSQAVADAAFGALGFTTEILFGPAKERVGPTDPYLPFARSVALSDADAAADSRAKGEDSTSYILLATSTLQYLGNFADLVAAVEQRLRCKVKVVSAIDLVGDRSIDWTAAARKVFADLAAQG